MEKKAEARKMERIWKIYSDPFYQECLRRNREAEKGRIFCIHDLQHFLDVARIAYIFALERNYSVSKEEIYAASLLHDIGKWRQYTEKIPHNQASAEAAEGILDRAGFQEEEKERILCAILEHRKKPDRMEPDRMKPDGRECAEQSKLAEIIYDADKTSRSCFACEAEGECNWADSKKNMRILW